MITPEWSEIIRDAINDRLLDVFTATIGEVQAYDPITQTADVQPVMQHPYNIGDGEIDHDTLPVVPNVPVVWPRAGGFFIHLPLKQGDHVLLVFTHDSVADWRETGSESQPADLRRHSLGSALAIAGVGSKDSPLSANPLDIAVRQAGLCFGEDGTDRQVSFTEDGFIQFGGLNPLGAPGGTVPPGISAISPVAMGISTQQQIDALQQQVTALSTALTVYAAMATALAAGLAVLTPVTGIADPTGALTTAMASTSTAAALASVAAALAVETGTAQVELAAQTAQSTMVKTV